MSKEYSENILSTARKADLTEMDNLRINISAAINSKDI